MEVKWEGKKKMVGASEESSKSVYHKEDNYKIERSTLLCIIVYDTLKSFKRKKLKKSRQTTLAGWHLFWYLGHIIGIFSLTQKQSSWAKFL